MRVTVFLLFVAFGIVMANFIDKRDRARGKLNRSEITIRALLNAIPDMMFRLNINGTYLEFKAGEFAPYIPPDLFLNKTVGDIMPQALAEKTMFHIEQILKTGKTDHMEYQLENNGVLSEYECRFAICGKEEVLAIVRDVTERKKAEQSLQESEERYRSIFNHSNDGIFIIKPDQDRIVYTNPKVGDLLGYSPKELLSLPISAVHPDEMDKLMDFTQSVFNEGSGWTDELTCLTKQGTKLNVEISASLVRLEGENHIIVQVRDVTYRKQAEDEKNRLEEQFFQSQKMESLGRLAGGVAHDFNNILTIIMGWAEMLHMKYKVPSTIEGQAAESILRGSHRAANLIKQLLGFARGGKYNPQPLDIKDAIKEAMAVSEKIFEKTVKVIFDFEEPTDVIEADRNQIEQVLTNLIVNASDAMPTGGELHFKTENVWLSEEYVKQHIQFALGHYLKLSITDSGIGMSQEIQEHMFEPFFTTKAQEKGTGLGLATVYGIIKNHGGQIQCYSAPGEGTTFTIYLPATEKQVIADKNEKGDLSPGTATILIIDDEKMVRVVAQKQLEQLGYRVLSAADGLKAVDIYKKKQKEIDLVLLDMIMPNMAGRETYRELKEINPDIKVIVVSGFSITGKVTEILEEGALGFVHKPFSLSELSSVIAEGLRK